MAKERLRLAKWYGDDSEHGGMRYPCWVFRLNFWAKTLPRQLSTSKVATISSGPDLEKIENSLLDDCWKLHGKFWSDDSVPVRESLSDLERVGTGRDRQKILSLQSTSMLDC